MPKINYISVLFAGSDHKYDKEMGWNDIVSVKEKEKDIHRQRSRTAK